MQFARYCKGWASAIRAYRMARRKKHGAGNSPMLQAMKIAAGYRFVVDGQYCRPMRPPFYLRQVKWRPRQDSNLRCSV